MSGDSGQEKSLEVACPPLNHESTEGGFASYNVDISPAHDGKSEVFCREACMRLISDDPEHDICHHLILAEYEDGPVQFWRGSTPTLSHRSIAVMAGLRVKMGVSYPYDRVKRREGWPQISKNPAPVRTVAGETPLADTRVAEGQEP